MKLLTPRNHGDGAWVFVANYGGGLVDGDRLRVGVDVHAGAMALLGSQASTKVYRAPSPAGCASHLDARVGAGATLVVVPDPVTCFAEARFAQVSDVALDADASLLLVDGLTSGRGARGERWAFARYASRTRIVRDGQLVVRDAVVLDPAHGNLQERMGRFDVLFTMYALGPKLAAVRAAACASLPALARRSDVVQSVSLIEGGARSDADAMVLRIAAVSIERGATALRAILATLPEMLGDDPFARKW